MPHPSVKAVTFQRTIGGYAVGDTFRHQVLGECQVQKLDGDDLIVVTAAVRGSTNVFRLRQADDPRLWPFKAE